MYDGAYVVACATELILLRNAERSSRLGAKLHGIALACRCRIQNAPGNNLSHNVMIATRVSVAD